MPAVVPAWLRYHRRNRRDERMAELWTRDVVAHLRGLPWLGPDRAVLDFGCGYFDAGLALADRAGRVDGIDTDPHAAAVARDRVRAAGVNSTIYASDAGLPAATYDLILANSVFQYLGDDAGVADTLALFRRVLKPGGRGVVLLADLIPTRYSKPLDACRSLGVAARNGVLPAMLAHLWKAARCPDGVPLHRIDPGRIAELAAAAGFACERLPRNLTPSRRRYTCVLTASSRRVGGGVAAGRRGLRPAPARSR
jgi:SAM-dependent methyltransferase